jgi:hypothetical protein
MEGEEFSFRHDEGFEPEEASGHIKLGKFEAEYESLFAEVIEDGVITLEERSRLNRAADLLGLDRMRLRKLEEALQAAYEARHHVRIREIADEAPPAPSLVLPGGADTRVLSLERRVAELQAQVADLQRELEEARAHVAVEVDISGLVPAPASGVDAVEETAEELVRRLRTNPRDAATLHTLYRAYNRSADLDRQWLVAHVLTYLGSANPMEQDTEGRFRVPGLIKPTSSLSAQGWTLLFHPDEEILTGQIFAVIAPAVLLGRVSVLRRDKALPRLDPSTKQDPKVSTLQAVRCFSWAGAILGLGSPPLYADPDYPGSVEMVLGVPPATRLGKLALSGRSPLELAFLAGRHLSWYREEHFIRLLVESIPDLEDLFLSALSIANAGIPLSADTRQRVAPIARAIEPVLESAGIDRLRGHLLRFLDEGGRTNLQRWATAAERTAARAGLLLANDLRAAHAIFQLEDPEAVPTKMDDLILFATSDQYANLRKQIGLSRLSA